MRAEIAFAWFIVDEFYVDCILKLSASPALNTRDLVLELCTHEFL